MLEVSKIGIQSLLYSQNQDFSRTGGFHELLDNVELITYMKFKEILITGCRDMDKNSKNAPQMGNPLFIIPKDSFQISSSATYGAPTSCKNQSLRYLKQMDRRTNRQIMGQRTRVIRIPLDKPGSNMRILLLFKSHIICLGKVCSILHRKLNNDCLSEIFYNIIYLLLSQHFLSKDLAHPIFS